MPIPNTWFVFFLLHGTTQYCLIYSDLSSQQIRRCGKAPPVLVTSKTLFRRGGGIPRNTRWPKATSRRTLHNSLSTATQTRQRRRHDKGVPWKYAIIPILTILQIIWLLTVTTTNDKDSKNPSPLHTTASMRYFRSMKTSLPHPHRDQSFPPQMQAVVSTRWRGIRPSSLSSGRFEQTRGEVPLSHPFALDPSSSLGCFEQTGSPPCHTLAVPGPRLVVFWPFRTDKGIPSTPTMFSFSLFFHLYTISIFRHGMRYEGKPPLVVCTYIFGCNEEEKPSSFCLIQFGHNEKEQTLLVVLALLQVACHNLYILEIQILHPTRLSNPVTQTNCTLTSSSQRIFIFSEGNSHSCCRARSFGILKTSIPGCWTKGLGVGKYKSLACKWFVFVDANHHQASRSTYSSIWHWWTNKLGKYLGK